MSAKRTSNISLKNSPGKRLRGSDVSKALSHSPVPSAPNDNTLQNSSSNSSNQGQGKRQHRRHRQTELLQRPLDIDQLQNRFLTKKEIQAEREELAESVVSGQLIEGTDQIHIIIAPRGEAGSVFSSIADIIHLELEHLLNPNADGSDASSILTHTMNLLYKDAKDESPRSRRLRTRGYKAKRREFLESLRGILEELQVWVRHHNKGKAGGKKETKLYTPFQSFVHFVAPFVKFLFDKLGLGTLFPSVVHQRCIICYPKTNRKPLCGDDDRKIDIGLTTCRPGDLEEQLPDMSYADIFAIVEAKYSNTRKDKNDAYKQLVDYSRHMYAAQPNRRFILGQTSCGTEVRVCLFSNDCIFASNPMDVSISAGRREYIGLLVNLSLCDKDQLGYDPTMTWDSEHEYWIIECPDTTGESSGSQATKTYYFRDEVAKADSLFGRHTRCFLVTDEDPAGDRIKPKFVVKDSWPEVLQDHDDTRDEVMFMRRITEELANSDVEDLVYPKLKTGGRVSFDTDGGRFEDNTRNVLGPLYSLRKPDNTAIPFRVHKRLVMSPIGEPLETVGSVHELIVVLGDAMRCHTEVLRRCNILHRDISDSNILVVREEGKPLRGLLMDFDNALDVKKINDCTRTVQSGSNIYMSINNLLGPNVERTELDDWEALLYLVCLNAIVGIGERYQRSPEEMRKFEIKNWRTGNTQSVGISKAGALATIRAFERYTIHQFKSDQPDIKDLQKLAGNIYSNLFWNPTLSNGCCMGTADIHIDGMWFNPFEERASQRGTIASSLLEIMEKAWRDSMMVVKALADSDA
ncbi:hypothetical protein DL89DRAFT_316891 [Linderina pennispora]|uniref:Protein kinase domain-containing protein n=1 Tax=Linderina pennispora TaxID=61395 RepID=A0A1Y1W830_9FUNG|nr:uncharacterized protein DL89DRAFT_316891 [Linderina pennispora]ORX69545.1 hypothetical protein DL89DRAFT_316891 [Linderina pennispora]